MSQGGSSEPSQPEVRPQGKTARRAIAARLFFLALSLIALYVLWPALLKVLDAAPRLLSISPLWFGVMFVSEVASFACVWALQRMSLRTKKWFAVATSQMAGNAVSRIVPGGAAAGGAVQFRMLAQGGVDATRVGTGLAAASLISTATLLALPILSLPAALAGQPVPSGLRQAALMGFAVFILGFAVGWVLLSRDGALQRVGTGIQSVLNKFRRARAPLTGLAQRLVAEREEILAAMGKRWREALLFSLGNWLFDYLALLAALTAVGAHPRPSLVLLAYVASMVLGMIPITPGGLGFVEAGLTAMLALAKVGGADAAVATLAYRLVSYWLPLPAGFGALLLYRRRYGDRSRPLTAG
jgi:uncharacterized protein (TIRG00374 family)